MFWKNDGDRRTTGRGKQSGHIIFRHHATTGDGLLTSLKLMEVVRRTGLKLSELSGKWKNTRKCWSMCASIIKKRF